MTRLVLTVLILLISATAFAFDPPKDMKWGMSLEEIQLICSTTLCIDTSDTGNYLVSYQACQKDEFRFKVGSNESSEASIQLGNKEGLVGVEVQYLLPSDDLNNLIIDVLKTKYGDPLIEIDGEIKGAKYLYFMDPIDKTTISIFTNFFLTLINYNSPDYAKLSELEEKNKLKKSAEGSDL